MDKDEYDDSREEAERLGSTFVDNEGIMVLS